MQLGVPRSAREICHKLAELGWLFRKVQAFIEGKKTEKTAGLVVQVRGSVWKVLEWCESNELFFPVVSRVSVLLSLKNWQSITALLQCWRPK